MDEKVQPEAVVEATVPPVAETATPNPEDALLEKMMAKLQPVIDSRVEDAKRKFQSISDRDVKKATEDARRAKREADTLREVINGIPVDPETRMKIQLARYQAEERSQNQFSQENDVERQRVEFEGKFEENASQFVRDMGFDTADARLDWGKDSQDYLERMKRIQGSVAKIVKEDRTSKETKAKADMEEMKQSIRKELGLDSVEVGYATRGVPNTNLSKLRKDYAEGNISNEQYKEGMKTLGK